MRFSKIALFSSLFVILVVGELINESNSRLGFPARNQSVANALYSAIELPLSVFPQEQIEGEIDTMKKNIRVHSKEQFQEQNPDVNLAYKIHKSSK